jgi:hypothetical protein
MHNYKSFMSEPFADMAQMHQRWKRRRRFVVSDSHALSLILKKCFFKGMISMAITFVAF